jgi:hypothetical protein
MPHKVWLGSVCERGQCREPALWAVVDHGSEVGRYCIEHADERLKEIERFDTAIHRTTSEAKSLIIRVDDETKPASSGGESINGK